MDFGDRMGATFKLYRSNFATFVTITAVIIVPLQLVSILVGGLLSRDLPVDPETGLVDVAAIDRATIVAYTAAFIVATIIAAIGSLLATGGITKAAVDSGVGRTADWQDSLGFAVKKLGPLIAGTILFGLGILGVVVTGTLATVVLMLLIDGFGALIGVIGAIAAAVFLGVSWSIWVPPVLVEGKGAAAALGRSTELVRGRRWPILGYLIVVYLLIGLIDAIAGGVVLGFTRAASSAGAFNLLQPVVNIALTVLTTPIAASAIVVLYVDQRVRAGSFDAFDLAADLAAADDNPFGSLPPDDRPPPEPPSDDPPPLDGI
jgi:hypothetical protein